MWRPAEPTLPTRGRQLRSRPARRPWPESPDRGACAAWLFRTFSASADSCRVSAGRPDPPALRSSSPNHTANVGLAGGGRNGAAVTPSYMPSPLGIRCHLLIGCIAAGERALKIDSSPVIVPRFDLAGRPPAFYRAPGGEPMFDVTVTFDNGPEPSITPGVLDVLARRGVRSTFFVIGSKLQ